LREACTSHTLRVMSNKQAPRAARTTTHDPRPAPDRAALRASLRLRVGTGMTAGGAIVSLIGTVLPWVTQADGTSTPGIGTIPGIGAFILGVAVVALAATLYLRPDRPNAGGLVWAALFACMGIGVMVLVVAFTTDTSSGKAVAMGILPAMAGGFIGTMGVRGLLEGR
jgi:hypothetical protein